MLALIIGGAATIPALAILGDVTELIDGAMPGGACVRIVWPRTKLAETRAVSVSA